LVIYHVSTITSEIAFNSNKYDDIMSFTASTLGYVYLICFICKKLESCLCSRIFSYIGSRSFYIMGLQFTGFKCCTYILNQFGYNFNMAELTTPQIDNVFLLLLYMVFGVLIPILIVNIFRYSKKMIFNQVSS
jgi:fucose 4-O-acetylase-like acetyltransferase